MNRQRASMARALSGLSEEQARAVWEALSQWADNERDEYEPGHEPERLRFVYEVVERLEAEMARLAGSP